MIQRKQTLYLFLNAVLGILMLCMNPPLIQGSMKDAQGLSHTYLLKVMQAELSSKGHEDAEILPYSLIALSILVFVGVSLVSVFFFKRLDLQKRIAAANTLLILLIIGSIYFYQSIIVGHIYSESVQMQTGPALALPLLFLIVNFLALQGIKKDIELLASADRLR